MRSQSPGLQELQVEEAGIPGLQTIPLTKMEGDAPMAKQQMTMEQLTEQEDLTETDALIQQFQEGAIKPI